ncbi:MAG: histone deacetylase [Vezdaea aestivalis]|nr:MAG: histone deacetylase [Vezdaea aestivalis]
MTRNSIVHEYEHPQPGSTSTFTPDDRVQMEILRNGVPRPQGYTVSWHGNPDVEKNHFGEKHPMKPWRLTLTKQLVLAYGLHEAMDMYLCRAASVGEMAEFHKQNYLTFLKTVLPTDEAKDSHKDYLGEAGDCPIFDGLFDHCSLYAGASLDAARKLTQDQSDIAINWSGGLHHAKKGKASGFCYINDIVLAILELLRFHPRVLYIDIDVHHGDGVESAFWSTDRVMTLSLHKYDPTTFFPGTGPLDSTGPKSSSNPGAHHSLNVPLQDGIDDSQYLSLFKDIVAPTINAYDPRAIVIQCGGDSLGGDRIGAFNLNIAAHGACVEYVKTFGRPLLVLGGGGYTPRNVARLWTYETAVCVGADLPDALPSNTPYLRAFAPDLRLLPELGHRNDNRNTEAMLEDLRIGIWEQLRFLKGAPSVGMKVIPEGVGDWMIEGEEREREEREDKEEWRRDREKGKGARGEMVD